MKALSLETKDGTKGPLQEFIEGEINSYEEPKRRGTPKGQPIGFSRKKYYATLLALTDIPVKDQAKYIGVSPEVLYVWRTEQEFWDMVNKHAEEYADLVVRRIAEDCSENSERSSEKYEKGLKSSIATELSSPLSPSFHLFASERELYSGVLVYTLLEKGQDLEALKRALGKDIDWAWAKFQVMLLCIDDKKQLRKAFAPSVHLDSLSMVKMLESCIGDLRKPKLNKRHRKVIISKLRVVKTHLKLVYFFSSDG